MHNAIMTRAAQATWYAPRRDTPRRTVAGSVEALIEHACRPVGLGCGDARALAACARTHSVGTGEVVLSRSEVATSLWLVMSGRVAQGTRGSHGLLQHRHSVQVGQWLDLVSALAHGCHAEDAVAETPAVLCELPLQAVLQLGSERPQLLVAVATILASATVALADNVRDLMFKDVQSRCATWLLGHAELAAGSDQRTGTLLLQQRKRQIALQLGTTAETLSRTLRQLCQRGLIEMRGYVIHLLDVPALQRLADPQGRGVAPR